MTWLDGRRNKVAGGRSERCHRQQAGAWFVSPTRQVSKNLTRNQVPTKRGSMRMRWTLLAIALLVLLPVAAAQQPTYRLDRTDGDCCMLKEPGEALELEMTLQRSCSMLAYRLPATVARLSAEAEHFTIELPAELELPEQLCPAQTTQKASFTARLIANEDTPRETPLQGTLRAEVDGSLWETGGKFEYQVPSFGLAALPVSEPATEAEAPEAASQTSPGAGVLLLAGLAIAAFVVSHRTLPRP
jgi:hypothetical protein